MAASVVHQRPFALLLAATLNCLMCDSPFLSYTATGLSSTICLPVRTSVTLPSLFLLRARSSGPTILGCSATSALYAGTRERVLRPLGLPHSGPKNMSFLNHLSRLTCKLCVVFEQCICRSLVSPCYSPRIKNGESS